MDNCIFCKIIARELPADIVHEDEHTLSFLSINPDNDGHTLVIPKEHHVDLITTPAPVLAQLMESCQKVAQGVMKGMQVDGYNLIQNNGAVAGQVIFHIHFHIIPRLPDDGFKHWKGVPYRDSEHSKEVAQKIQQSI